MRTRVSTASINTGLTRLSLAVLCSASAVAFAQTPSNPPVTTDQRTTAQQVSQQGVPVSALAPDAPDEYTIQRGDTLWRISGLFLQQPWRWPELWGMNMEQIRNPHLIFPGQVLVLNRFGDRAFLSFGGMPTVRLSPRVRAEQLADAAIPPIPASVIEPFLTQSRIVDAQAHAQAPRIVAAPEGRLLLSRGDRAYARGQYSNQQLQEDSLLSTAPGRPQAFGVYRNATPIVDPGTGEVLGYEAQFIGRAQLVRGEQVRTTPTELAPQVEPATIDIVMANEEIRVGDRLLPEANREISMYVPQASATPQSGQIVKSYGREAEFSGQNQVVVINRGTEHGLQPGNVLAILKNQTAVTDTTDAARTPLQLPSERNGLMMVFRAYERVSYALVLNITDGIRAGDRFTNP